MVAQTSGKRGNVWRLVPYCIIFAIFASITGCIHGREFDVEPTPTPDNLVRAGYRLPGRELYRASTPAPVQQRVIGIVIETDGKRSCIPLVGSDCSLAVVPTMIPTNTPRPRPTKQPAIIPTSTPAPRPTRLPTKQPAPIEEYEVKETPTQESGVCTGSPAVGLNVRDRAAGDQVLTSFTPERVQVLLFEARRQDAKGVYWYAFWCDFIALGLPAQYGWVIETYITWNDTTGCGSLPTKP